MTRKTFFVLAMMGCGAAVVWASRVSHNPRPATTDSAIDNPSMSPSMSVEDAPSQAAPAAAVTPDIPAATDSNTEDAQCQELLDQSNQGEAMAWLTATGVSHGVSHWEKQEAVDLIQGFYSAGAKQVFVVDVDTVDQVQIASQFVVVLPGDAGARKQVFAKEADFEAQYGDDGTADVGQKYLHLTTD